VNAVQTAERIRAATGRHKGCFDPVRVAHRLGARVVAGELASHIAAGLVKEPGQDPVIVLNARDSVNRKRFNCAHQLGHLISFEECGQDQYDHVELRSGLFGPMPLEEGDANAFAAALLMPADETLRLRRKGATDIELGLRFGVPREAAVYRLRQLGY
jgi:Zn-dependent peptidase ImmA (M78 family)